jgi:predicted nuclease of predicted toxin-antitoxin system
VRFLDARGCDAEHVRDIGLSQATDAEIWEFATKGRCVLISKDEDFMQLVPKSPATRLVWVRLGNCRTPFLLEAFERLWVQVEEHFSRGEQIIEIR